MDNKSGGNIKETVEKKVVWTCNGKNKGLKKIDGDGCAEEEKERKTEAEVVGRHQARLDRERIIRQSRKAELRGGDPSETSTQHYNWKRCRCKRRNTYMMETVKTPGFEKLLRSMK